MLVMLTEEAGYKVENVTNVVASCIVLHYMCELHGHLGSVLLPVLVCSFPVLFSGRSRNF